MAYTSDQQDQKLDSLQFEMERRVIVFRATTSMPDKTQLGFNADPNTASASATTDGEKLIANAPISTRYAQLDDSLTNIITEWVKTEVTPVAKWIPLGSGGGEWDETGTPHESWQIDNDANGVILENNEGNLVVTNPNPDPANPTQGTITVGGVTISLLNGFLYATDGVVGVQALPESGLTSGGVWCADITPTNPIENVGNKVTVSDGEVLEKCSSTTQEMTIKVMALPGIGSFKPAVEILVGADINTATKLADAYLEKPEGVSATMQPLWIGETEIELTPEQFTTPITIWLKHADGATSSVIIDAAVRPVVNSAVFNGTYPILDLRTTYPGIVSQVYNQSAVKPGDVYRITVSANQPITSLTLVGLGTDVFAGRTYTQTDFISYTEDTVNNEYTATLNGTVHEITASSTTSPDLIASPFTVYVTNSAGANSNNYISTTTGSVSGTNTINYSNYTPEISTSITYPASQRAIKDSEVANVDVTLSRFNSGVDIAIFQTPLSQVNLTLSNVGGSATPGASGIGNTSGIVPATRIAGDYNVTNGNMSIDAVNLVNGVITQYETVVWISDALPTITIENDLVHSYISGGNGYAAGAAGNGNPVVSDPGATVQTHPITLSSNQMLLQAPTLSETGSEATITAFNYSASALEFTATLSVHDDYTKGTYSWGEFVVVGLAGQVATIAANTINYRLQGFAPRTIVIPAFGTTGNIGSTVTTSGWNNNLVTSLNSAGTSANWGPKLLTSKQNPGFVGTVVDGWTINELDGEASTTTFIINDTNAAGSVSQDSYVTNFQELPLAPSAS